LQNHVESQRRQHFKTHHNRQASALPALISRPDFFREYVFNANWRCLQNEMFWKTGNRVDGSAGRRHSQLKPVAAFDLICVIYILPISSWLGQPVSNRPCHAVGMKIKKSSRFQISSFSLFKAHGFNSLPPSGPPALSENRMAGTNSSAALRMTTPPRASGVRYFIMN
jgi:hypothetical protein